MTQYVQLVYNVSPNLHKAFATKYVPELFAAIQQNILGSPTNNVRNMGKDKIDLILNLMKQVLQRCYSPSQASSLTEDFGFQIALQLFNSDFLERKLQGIKHIQDFLKSNKVRSYISNNQRDEINKLVSRRDKWHTLAAANHFAELGCRLACYIASLQSGLCAI